MCLKITKKKENRPTYDHYDVAKVESVTNINTLKPAGGDIGQLHTGQGGINYGQKRTIRDLRMPFLKDTV